MGTADSLGFIDAEETDAAQRNLPERVAALVIVLLVIVAGIIRSSTIRCW